MHIYLNNVIYNMDRYDSCRVMEKIDPYPRRIAFFKDGVEEEYVEFDTDRLVDENWARIVSMVNNWYT